MSQSALNQAALSQPGAALRDIHVPADVSWWPLAPGWWILAGLIISVVVASYLWWRWYRSRHLLRVGLAEIGAIEADWHLNRNSLAAVQALSILLRRIALSRYPRTEVASLVGDDWLHWLDRRLEDSPFVRGPGRRLTDVPYMSVSTGESVELDIDVLLQLSQRWLKTEFARKPWVTVYGVRR